MSEKVVLQGRATKEVELPKCGAKVEFYASVIASDISGINFNQEKDVSISEGIKMLARLIKTWNIYDSEEAAEPIPVTEENLQRLEVEDVTFLMNQIAEFQNEEKKD